MELCSDTGNKVACYHMARCFEKKGDFKQAIALFQRASAISNAMWLCRVWLKNSHHVERFSSIRIINWTSTWQPLPCKALWMTCSKRHDTLKHHSCKKIALSFSIASYGLFDQTGHKDLLDRSVRLAWLRKPLIWLSNTSDTRPWHESSTGLFDQKDGYS